MARITQWIYVKVVLVVWVLLYLSSCASTETLYAEYDAATCLVQLSEHETDNKPEQVLWEPAVYFEHDDDTVSDEQMAKLDASFKVLERFPKLTVGLHGSSDERGDSSHNNQLAYRRAHSVASYLIEKGLSESRIIHLPVGEIAGHLGLDNTAGLARNRRVELVLLDHLGAPLPLALVFSEALPIGNNGNIVPKTVVEPE